MEGAPPLVQPSACKNLQAAVQGKGTQTDNWIRRQSTYFWEAKETIEFTEQSTGKENTTQSRSFSRGLLRVSWAFNWVLINAIGDQSKRISKESEADTWNCPFLLRNLFTLPHFSKEHFFISEVHHAFLYISISFTMGWILECAELSINSGQYIF